MHKASLDERDRPCNAYCAGEVHADLAYATMGDCVDALVPSLQAAADQRAHCGALRPITVLSVQPAPEAPSPTTRYPACGAPPGTVAYLVRYRLGKRVTPQNTQP